MDFLFALGILSQTGLDDDKACGRSVVMFGAHNEWKSLFKVAKID